MAIFVLEKTKATTRGVKFALVEFGLNYMKLKGKTIKGEGNYWALLCDCGIGKARFLVCGVYPSKKEAQEVNKEVKDLSLIHISEPTRPY